MKFLRELNETIGDTEARANMHKVNKVIQSAKTASQLKTAMNMAHNLLMRKEKKFKGQGFSGYGKIDKYLRDVKTDLKNKAKELGLDPTDFDIEKEFNW